VDLVREMYLHFLAAKMSSLVYTVVNRTMAAVGCVRPIGLVSVSIRGIALSVSSMVWHRVYQQWSPSRYSKKLSQRPKLSRYRRRLGIFANPNVKWACTSIAHGLLTLLMSSACLHLAVSANKCGNIFKCRKKVHAWHQ